LIKSHLDASEARAGISGNFTIEVVLNHDDFLAAVSIRLQHSLNGSVGCLSLASSNVPCVANHELEIVVAVNARGHVLVVVLELLNGDDVIALVRLP